MANNPYATSKQAADSVGITPGDIGVAANDYVRKKELIATNKFDADALASYGNNDYVMLKDIAKGAFQVTLSVNSDVTSRGTVQINNGTAGATATARAAMRRPGPTPQAMNQNQPTTRPTTRPQNLHPTVSRSPMSTTSSPTTRPVRHRAERSAMASKPTWTGSTRRRRRCRLPG